VVHEDADDYEEDEDGNTYSDDYYEVVQPSSPTPDQGVLWFY
jgi:hypothetical protein